MADVCEHKHIIIRAELGTFFGEEQSYELDMWIEGLITDLNMNIMLGPISHYLNRPGLKGWSAATLIETSHIALHSWDENDPVLLQLDVYTCGEMNIDVVRAAIEQFDIKKFDYYLIDRAKEIELISKTRTGS